MKNRKTAVYLMTAMLLLLFAATELILLQRENFPFAVEVTADGGRERIRCWRRDGCYYVFLPGYAQPDETVLVTNPLFPVWIAGERVGSGTVCGEFAFGEKLNLKYKKWGKTQSEAVYFCQSDQIPTLYIDTASGSMDYIHEEKGNAEAGKLRLYSPGGTLDSAADIQAINGRGNSTWDSEKKPYSLELNQKTDLLGMGKAKNWILLANNFDSSNMGNKLGFDFAARAGCAHTPECQWVDLYLNGDYAGLYVLSERNEVDPQRVDIPQKDSFLISMEYAPRWIGRSYPAFFTRRENFLRIRHAGMEEAWIQEIWQSVEDSLFAEDGIDPRTGKSWDQLIDVDSWARQFLLWDVLAEFDAGAVSKFFYYDGQSDRVFAGPVWDMDNILNECGLHSPNILASERRYVWNREQESMFYRLYQMDSFRQRVQQLYRQKYRPLLLELAETGMDAYLEQIRQAAFLNSLRWDGDDTPEVIRSKKAYLLQRIAFLDDYWQSESDYCVLEVSMDVQWRSYAVRRGETAQFLPSEEITWLDYETGQPFDITAPVTEDRAIRAVHPWEQEG